MSEPRTETAQPQCPGCVVLLVDESPALEARVVDGTKSKAGSIATAVNSLLGRLADQGPPLDVALVGYRRRADGAEVIGSRWSGSLEGRPFVSAAQWAAAPLAVEDRVRRIPDPSGYGVARRETVRFPVWYSPVLGSAASKPAALEACRQMLVAWLGSGTPVHQPPLVLSILGNLEPEDGLAAAVRPIFEIDTPAGPPLVFHAHLAGPVRLPPTLYPSTDAHLAPGPVRELFPCASVLPELLAASLRQVGVTVIRGARGLIYNAGMGDLIRFLSLVRTYAAYQPAAPQAPTPPEPSPQPAATDPETITTPPETATLSEPTTTAPEPTTPSESTTTSEPASAPETAALLVLLLDRSVEEPDAGQEHVTWSRLQQHANEILAELARRGQGRIETALVCYGSDPSGGDDVQIGFAGTLAGPEFVHDTELAAGALREEEVCQQVSNGIGGLVSVTRRKPIFIDLEPTAAASPKEALEAVARLVADWRAENPGAAVGPIVLHLTRACGDPGELASGVEHLRQGGRPGPETRLYHLVVTQSPHRSVAYPAEPSAIESAGLRTVWELSSPLLGRQGLAARRPSISAESRGLVINGRFDLLFDGIEEALAGRRESTLAPAGE